MLDCWIKMGWKNTTEEPPIPLKYCPIWSGCARHNRKNAQKCFNRLKSENERVTGDCTYINWMFVTVLHEYLCMTKLCPTWWHVCSHLNKNNIKGCYNRLRICKHNTTKFLCRFITIVETWAHFNTCETKQHSKQWTTKGEQTPAKAKLNANNCFGKVMATAFFWTHLEKFLLTTLKKEKQLVVNIMQIYCSISVRKLKN